MAADVARQDVPTAVAPGAERERLWARVVVRYLAFAGYQAGVMRQSPVAVPRPAPPAQGP